MQKIFILISLLASSLGFCDSLTLDNLTPYPGKQSKMAVEWADSFRETQESNQNLVNGSPPNSKKLTIIRQTGSVVLTIPSNADHFRVLVWSQKGEANPDLLTNWIDVTSGKSYKLEKDQLFAPILLLGSGC